jgi:hypothetical protein
VIVECPHCESQVDCEEKGSVALDGDDGDMPSKAVLLECKICRSPLFGITELIQITEDAWDWGHAYRLWPAQDRDIDRGIPEIVRLSLIEAENCFKAKAFSACAVMCGRTIEGVCKHHAPETGNLAGGLKKLKEDGVIDTRIYSWGEALRSHRNLGAHATTEKVSKEDARDLLDFSIAICDYVFVLNEKFNRFQARQKTA